jgi:hypothetical protein
MTMDRAVLEARIEERIRETWADTRIEARAKWLDDRRRSLPG